MTKKGVGLAPDRHLPLLHGLQEGALDLGRGAVDLVGQEQVCKDRPPVGAEFPRLGLEDHRANDVAWEQVRCELDALKLDAQCRPQGFDKQCLGQARHAL